MERRSDVRYDNTLAVLRRYLAYSDGKTFRVDSDGALSFRVAEHLIAAGEAVEVERPVETVTCRKKGTTRERIHVAYRSP